MLLFLPYYHLFLLRSWCFEANQTIVTRQVQQIKWKSMGWSGLWTYRVSTNHSLDRKNDTEWLRCFLNYWEILSLSGLRRSRKWILGSKVICHWFCTWDFHFFWFRQGQFLKCQKTVQPMTRKVGQPHHTEKIDIRVN